MKDISIRFWTAICVTLLGAAMLLGLLGGQKDEKCDGCDKCPSRLCCECDACECSPAKHCGCLDR